MHKAEDITLYVPCFNAGRTLVKCVESIRSQTIQPGRIFLVDDGSDDDLPYMSVEVIKHSENLGLASARNTALENCETGLLGAIDSDVALEPNWLEQVLAAINTGNYVGVGGKMLEGCLDTVADRWRSVHMCQHWGDAPVENPRFLYGANTLFRTDVLKEMGGYDVRCRTNNEDRRMSDAISAAGYNLYYTPRAMCTHLRSDTDETIMRNYWSWHRAKGLIEGDFDSPAGLISRIERVNFGIFDYRYNMDTTAGRQELLVMDRSIPWLFCAMDLELYNRRTGKGIPDLAAELSSIRDEQLLNLLEKYIITGHKSAEEEWFEEYLKAFRYGLKLRQVI